jgi:hypothetical protein
MRPRPVRARRCAFGARAGFVTGFDFDGFGFGLGLGFDGFGFGAGLGADRDLDFDAGFEFRFDFRFGAGEGFGSDFRTGRRGARARRTDPPSKASVARPQRSSSPRASSR